MIGFTEHTTAVEEEVEDDSSRMGNDGDDDGSGNDSFGSCG